MLSGETRGAGGGGLARHLLSQKADQIVQRIAGRFLAAQTLAEQIQEIVAGARHGRTKKAVWHVHVDPPPGFDTREGIGVFLKHLEHEFGLEKQARTGVFHIGKNRKGRLHAHLVYSLVRDDGKVIDLKNSYRRREKCAVLAAFDLGLPPPPIPKPRAIFSALMREGREDTAEWMSKHFDFSGPVRIAEISPSRRDVADRTGILVADIRSALADAWPPSSPARFAAALQISGLALARGEKAVVVVDSTGTAHSLARELRAAIRTAGNKPPTAAAVRHALLGFYLPTLEQLKETRNVRDKATPNPDRDAGHTPGRESSAPALESLGGARGRGEPTLSTPRPAQRDRDAPRAPRPSTRSDRGVIVRLAAALKGIDLAALRRRIAIAAKPAILGRILRERAAIHELKDFNFEILRTRLDNLVLAKDFNMKNYQPNKQNYKEALLDEFAGQNVAKKFGGRVHMFKQLETGSFRLLMHDGSWIEVDKHSGKIILFGRQGENAAIAAAILDEHPDFIVEELKRSGGASALSAAPQTKEDRRKLLSPDKIDELAKTWRTLGYDDLEIMQNCVIVNLASCKLYDYGDHVTVMGAMTDDDIVAFVAHNKAAWGGHRLTGAWSDKDRERIWLESQRQGITLSDYNPPAKLLATWEAEKAAMKSSGPANSVAAEIRRRQVDIEAKIEEVDTELLTQALDEAAAVAKAGQLSRLKERRQLFFIALDLSMKNPAKNMAEVIEQAEANLRNLLAAALSPTTTTISNLASPFARLEALQEEQAAALRNGEPERVEGILNEIEKVERMLAECDECVEDAEYENSGYAR